MTTTINQKVANPNFPTGGASGTTGTGNLVFSESPTINNPTLTGSVSANVNLRSGTLATLLPLAGGTSELGYATDVNALVRFNGTAGGATLATSGATLDFTFTNANIGVYANAGMSYIDCKNITTLNIKVDPTCTTVIYTINIRMPSIVNPYFTVNILGAGNGVNFYGQEVVIILAYQLGETVNYVPIGADDFADPSGPRFFTNAAGPISIRLFSNGVDTVSRYPCPELTEGQLNGLGTTAPTSSGWYFPYVLGPSTYSLTSGVVRNVGVITFPSTGIWMITGVLNLTTNTALVASVISAGVSLVSTSENPNSSSDVFGKGKIITNLNMPAGTTTQIVLPTVVNVFEQGQIRYQNVYAVFNTGVGTISASVDYRATKIT